MAVQDIIINKVFTLSHRLFDLKYKKPKIARDHYHDYLCRVEFRLYLIQNMIKHYIFSILIAAFSSAGIKAQNSDGYWDKDRATTKEIELCAGCRTVIRTDDLPVGTTELIYRITLLDENQKLAGSLASVLNAIPDSSGISQGSAGAVTLLSKISGEDQCTFSIFTTQKDAVNYKNTGDQASACFVYPTEVSKMAGRLTLQNSPCLKTDGRFLWFGFKSSNKLMKQKIVLEVVPWVNKKASRGWNAQAKQKFANVCAAKISNKPIIDKQQYCQCVLDKVQQAFTAQDFMSLATAEQDKVLEKTGRDCFAETGELARSYGQLRKDGTSLMEAGNYGEAITKYLEVISKQATIADYNNVGYSYIMTKQYLKAIKYLQLGEQIDASDLRIKANLAHAYLLSGDEKAAKQIYKKYQGHNVDERTSWKSLIESDFEKFRNAGFSTAHFKSVLRMVE